MNTEVRDVIDEPKAEGARNGRQAASRPGKRG
jgi:hypothetical protein